MRQLLSAMRRYPGIKDPFISTGDCPILDHAHRTLPASAEFNPVLPSGFRRTIDYLDLVPDIEWHIRVFPPERNPEPGLSGLVRDVDVRHP